MAPSPRQEVEVGPTTNPEYMSGNQPFVLCDQFEGLRHVRDRKGNDGCDDFNLPLPLADKYGKQFRIR